MKVNELFCRECVEQIYVPDVVRVDLLSIIEEKLKKVGFYYRIAYRVKAVDSTVDKLQFKDYRRPGTENEDKKMQNHSVNAFSCTSARRLRFYRSLRWKQR